MQDPSHCSVNMEEVDARNDHVRGSSRAAARPRPVFVGRVCWSGVSGVCEPGR